MKDIDDAYDLALELVKSEGWKKEKHDKDTVSILLS